eukprot:Skav202459  [mRNA]  locus=scaffold149:283706:287716:- [translate_table: standard]
MPPIKSPSTAAMFSMFAPATGVCTKEPMEVHMAAKPTSEWKAATVCGSAMGLTFMPRTRPAPPPITSRMLLITKLPSFKLTMAALMAPKTPTMPNLHPLLAVDIVANPPMAAMHSSALTVLTAFNSSGFVRHTKRNTRPGRSIKAE